MRALDDGGFGKNEARLYTKKETNGELTEGLEEARELSAANYGRDEWWLLLDPVQKAEAGGSS